MDNVLDIPVDINVIVRMVSEGKTVIVSYIETFKSQQLTFPGKKV